MRKFDAESRQQTAEIVARVALESSAGPGVEAGRARPSKPPRILGFAMRFERSTLPFGLDRDGSGVVSLTMPLEEGAATMRFRMTAIRPITWVDFWLALFAVGLASVLGLGIGQSLSSDLVQATYRVRALGTEDVLRGEDQLEVPVRFAQVETLNRAIDTLAGRFRVLPTLKSEPSRRETPRASFARCCSPA